ncbi:Josephin-like protein [Strongyloides ratti]|uniref:ubiquitinyl hydrolase 1 n=1 Tax=Strongyloides ratti TaxID=34506 RepID=A0A090KRT0_STRRB|nr:Josephin-like protein [Strongyloides ratti]CEF60100.1 Josephin-like protein [Strongyloides ratti]
MSFNDGNSFIKNSFYHEKQRKQLCLLHSLNNLFQKEKFNKHDLDKICEELDRSTWFNSHRSWLGLGDYDANVLMAALDKEGYTCTWFDSRLTASSINHNEVFGYIFNVPSESFFPFMKKRHWFCVIRTEKNYFYNLDSKLLSPSKISNFEEFTDTLLAQGNTLILIKFPNTNEVK